MMKNRLSRGASKADWLEAALSILDCGNVSNITIEGLARTLGISKSGFYWHFKNRDDLLRAILDYWVHEITEVITENTELVTLDPKARLRVTAEMILKHDFVRYEIGIRQWAMQNPGVAKAVKKVNRIRLVFVSQALEELGFRGDDLEMRAMLFVCYHTWESEMFREVSEKRRRDHDSRTRRSDNSTLELSALGRTQSLASRTAVVLVLPTKRPNDRCKIQLRL